MKDFPANVNKWKFPNVRHKCQSNSNDTSFHKKSVSCLFCFEQETKSTYTQWSTIAIGVDLTSNFWGVKITFILWRVKKNWIQHRFRRNCILLCFIVFSLIFFNHSMILPYMRRHFSIRIQIVFFGVVKNENSNGIVPDISKKILQFIK